MAVRYWTEPGVGVGQRRYRMRCRATAGVVRTRACGGLGEESVELGPRTRVLGGGGKAVAGGGESREAGSRPRTARLPAARADRCVLGGHQSFWITKPDPASDATAHLPP